MEKLVCWFRIPQVIIFDNGRQFDSHKFKDFYKELRIRNHYSSPRHPQANGQTKVTNQTFLKLIKTQLEGAKGAWPKELPGVLLAYRTMVRTPTGKTLFKLVFGTKAVIPVEVKVSSLRRTCYDECSNDEDLKLALDCLPEVRDDAAQRMALY